MAVKKLQECSFPSKLNETSLVLIPKKDNAHCIKIFTYCSIQCSLQNNRFKVIPLVTISENQSIFVGDRNIMDNVLVAFEILYNGNEVEVALKRDVSQIYDHVD